MANRRRSQQRARPRAARRAGERAALKRAGWAERRGRRVPPTVEGFETALRDRGYDGVAEVLISRHNQRMQRMIDVGDIMQRISLPLLAGYLPLGLAAEELGAHPVFRSRPTSPGKRFGDQRRAGPRRGDVPRGGTG